MRDLVANVALRDGHCSRKNFLSDVVPPRCVSLRLLPFYSQSSLKKRSSDAIKPVVVGLLAGLAFKHFLALASNIGISCFMATLYSILPRKKTSLALVQGAPFSNSGAV